MLSAFAESTSTPCGVNAKEKRNAQENAYGRLDLRDMIMALDAWRAQAQMGIRSYAFNFFLGCISTTT